MFELLQNHKLGEEQCYDQIICTCDLDGDGKLDYNEFIQAAINHKALLNQENIEIVFKMIDSNHDGKISVLELKEMFSSKSAINGGKNEDKVIKDIMLEVDSNNDNFISPHEFNNALTSLLNKTV